MTGSLAAPGGDPAQLRALAGDLETVAAGVRTLGAATPQLMRAIRARAAWTGPAAQASSGLSDDLGDGVAGIGPPLLKAADAVHAYAGALDEAQQAAAAYNRLAADLAPEEMAAGATGPAAMAALQLQDTAAAARSALAAWQAAGTAAADAIQAATAELGHVFPQGGPVRDYLATLPADMDPFAAPASLTGLAGTQVLGNPPAPDLGLGTVTDPPAADPGLGTVADPPAPDLGLGIVADPPAGLAREILGQPPADTGGLITNPSEQDGGGDEQELPETDEAWAQLAYENGQANFRRGDNPTYDEILRTIQTGDVTHELDGYVRYEASPNGRPVVVLFQPPSGAGQNYDARAFYRGPQNPPGS